MQGYFCVAVRLFGESSIKEVLLLSKNKIWGSHAFFQRYYSFNLKEKKKKEKKNRHTLGSPSSRHLRERLIINYEWDDDVDDDDGVGQDFAIEVAKLTLFP